MDTGENIITPKNPADHSAGSAPTPIAASSNAAAQAGGRAAPQEDPFLHSPSGSNQHHEIYFRLKATPTLHNGTLKFASSGRLCASLLAQLAVIPGLSDTGLFAPGKLVLTISKHHNASTRCFIYTASFTTACIATEPPKPASAITDLILAAQAKCEPVSKLPTLPKGFTFVLPIVTPNGLSETDTRCLFAYDRELLLGLTTVDFQVKIPSSVSISPQEDFALLIVQLFTPREDKNDSDYLALTRADRTRFASCCFPRKTVSTSNGDWMDELMHGSFALNFEDSDSRDIPIWTFLIFAAFFGMDPRFGNHQQYQLFIPTLHDSHQLERRPVAMREAVKSFRMNQAISQLLPSKPRRSRPKQSDATSSDTESETLFLSNISRRSEAILLLPEVPVNDSFTTLHYPPLVNIPFIHILKIPQAASIAPLLPSLQECIAVALDPPPKNGDCASDQITSLTQLPLPTAKLTCMSWDRHGRCKKGTDCLFTHSAVASSTACMSWDKFGSCMRGTSCSFIHHSAAIASDEFIGEGKNDTACIKFSQYRCNKGSRCPYRHDVRDGLPAAPDAPTLAKCSPLTDAKMARRMQLASPGRGSAQLTNLLFTLERPLHPSMLCDPIFYHASLSQLRDLTSLGLPSQFSTFANAAKSPAPSVLSPRERPSTLKLQALSASRADFSPLKLLPPSTAAIQTPAPSALSLHERPSTLTLEALSASRADLSPLKLLPLSTAAIQTATPLLSDIIRVAIDQVPEVPCDIIPPALIAARFTRSLLTSSIGDLNGYCSRGHKIFKRTPIRASETHKCSFCKKDHRTDVFTCIKGCSHSCMACLQSHNTAQAPPQCLATHCPGSCTMQALSQNATCWNGGHHLQKGSSAWHCGTCKFLICRACIISKNSTASSANASASMPP
jgi:hypothetical protein